MKLPPELNFLNPFFTEPSIALKQANWLLSDFDDNCWDYSFGFKKAKTIDWDVQLDDGSRLIDPKNGKLLAGLKYFITGTTNPLTYVTHNTGAPLTRTAEFNRALQVVDFLLLNAKNFQLARYGLAGLGRDALKLMLSEICSSRDTAEAIYGWSKRLSLYCLKLTLQTSAGDMDTALKKLPILTNITPDQIENNTLDIPLEIIPRVRAALYLHGLYRHSEKGYTANSVKLSKILYRDTLKGRFEKKPIAEILSVKDDDYFTRERLTIPVVTGEREAIGESDFYEYRRTLYSLGTLHEVGLPAPSVEDLNAAKKFVLKTDPEGRFRTLPSRVVFGAVKNAIEFHIRHGRTLIDGMCKVALHCKLNGIPSSELRDNVIQHIIGKDLRILGVEGLGLSRRAIGDGYQTCTKAPILEY